MIEPAETRDRPPDDPRPTRAWNRLHRFAIGRPVLVLVIALLVTAASATGIPRLRLRTDGHALVPEHAPEVLLDRAIREAFDLRDPVVILIRSRHPDGIFNPRALHLIEEISRQVEGIEGVGAGHVTSLETERGDRFRPGTLDFLRFLEPVPETAEELDRLREDLRALELYTGTLVSEDGAAAAVIVGVPPAHDRLEFLGELRRIAGDRATETEEIDILGAPVAEALLGIHILEDLGVPLGSAAEEARSDAGGEAEGSPGSLGRSIARRVGLLPLALVVMALIFLACYRSLAAALLPLLEAGACLTLVFGWMGWLGVPVYLTTAVLPVILTAVGVADEIHIFSRYTQRSRARPGEARGDTVRAVLDELRGALGKTSITTAIGFLSFSLSPIPPVRAFGIFMAVGIITCLLWSLTVIPALLVLLPRRGLPAVRAAGRSPAGSRFFSRLSAVIDRRRRAILWGAIALAALTPFGIARLEVQDSWIGGFSPESAFSRATRFYNERFSGAHLLLLRVDAGSLRLGGEIAGRDVEHHELRLPIALIPDPSRLAGAWITIERPEESRARREAENPRGRHRWSSWIEAAALEGGVIVATLPEKEGSPRFFLQPAGEELLHYEIHSQGLLAPESLRRLDALQERIEREERHAVGGVLGPTDYLKTTHFIVRKREGGSRRLPENPKRAQWLWGQLERIRGRERVRQGIDEEYGQGIVTVFLKNANFADTARLIETIRSHEREHLEPHGMRVDLAGDVAVSQTLIASIVHTQVRSLLLSLAGIVLVAGLLGRALRWGLLSVLPCALALAANFAVMGWLGIPLGVATSMFAGMILGIGVDYAIHLLERFRAAAAAGSSPEEACGEALAVAGPAILIDGLAVACGFGVLILSQVPANAHLGALAVVCIASCLAGSLLLAPALLMGRRPGGGGGCPCVPATSTLIDREEDRHDHSRDERADRGSRS